MPTAEWYDHDCHFKYPGMCSIPIKVTRPCAPSNAVRWQKDGNDNCCSIEGRGLCKLGEGDCDKDSDCEGSLVCGDDNCPWGDGDDCCTRIGMHRRTAQGWQNTVYYSLVWQLGTVLLSYCLIIHIAACPHGWEWKPQFSKCYKLSRSLSWNAANKECASLDPLGEATLTSIRSRKENDYMNNFLHSASIIWIGGTDKDKEGTWRWVN